MIEAPEKIFSAGELPPVDPEHTIDEIHQAVLNLHAIAKNLRVQRFTGGALRLDQVSSPKQLHERIDQRLLVGGKEKSYGSFTSTFFPLFDPFMFMLRFLFDCS